MTSPEDDHPPPATPSGIPAQETIAISGYPLETSGSSYGAVALKGAVGDDNFASATSPLPPTFVEFYHSELETLTKAVRAAGATWQDAEDAAEVAMIALLDRWAEVQSGRISIPLAYARRTGVRWWASQRRREQKDVCQGVLGGQLPIDGLDQRLSDWENQEWIQQLLKHLTPTQRQVMTLEVLTDLRICEIAEVLGKSPSTVRQNRYLARRTLKKLMEASDQ